MNPKLHGANLAFFVSALLHTIRGQYGSDQFMSYLTAESIVLDHNLAIAVRPFNLPDIQTNLDGVPVGADGKRYSLYGLALLGLLGAAECWRRQPALSVLRTAIAAASVLFTSTYVKFWHGDAAWGPRFLLRVTFLSMLPAGEVREHGLPLVRWKRATLSALVT